MEEQIENKSISLYVHEEVLNELGERLRKTQKEGEARRNGQRSVVINNGLRRYYELLRRTRHELREKFSAQELSLILDAVNGTIWEPTKSFLWLPHNISDAIALDGLDRKWGVDGEKLISKLEVCTPLELAALVDAAERFWQRSGEIKPEEALDF